MSNSLQPHGLQLARLLGPWDSSGKKTGEGCHLLNILLNIFKYEHESESCTVVFHSLLPHGLYSPWN